ncbi:MAG: fimbria major subunit [Prevotella sp.]|nr:fimbria major subunit [Prevotella sp.]
MQESYNFLNFATEDSTRSGIDDYYFHNEYAVSRLDIYFFDAETKEFAAKVIIRNLTVAETEWDDEYDITYIYDQVKLQVGLYDIFAVANYDKAPDKVEKEADLLDMVDAVTYSEGIEANIPDKGPVMTTRATALQAVDFVPWTNKEFILRLELERVMAKLQIGVSQNSFELSHNGRKYADINITNYKFVNLNKCYYLFQHTDILSELTGKPEFVFPDNYVEYEGLDNQYVVDPHFYQKTTNTLDANSFRKNYLSWFGAFTTEDFASMPSADNHGYAYILENTSFKTSQKNGYSPGIVFKAAVSPVFVYLYDSSLRQLKEEYRPEYWPYTLYLYNYNFYGTIQAVNVASGMMLDELETYSDSQLKPYGIKQCKFNMGVYETFYTYWLHHQNSDNDVMGPMQYGIVGNNFYRILVSGVNGMGNSVIEPEVLRDNYPNSYEDVAVE